MSNHKQTGLACQLNPTALLLQRAQLAILRMFGGELEQAVVSMRPEGT